MNLHVGIKRCTGNVLTRLVEESVLANFGNTIAESNRRKRLTCTLGVPRTQSNAGIGRRIELIIVLVVRHQRTFTADLHLAVFHFRGEIRAAGACICLECNTLAQFIRRVAMDNRLQAIRKIFGNQAAIVCSVNDCHFGSLILCFINAIIEGANCIRLLFICNFSTRCAVIIAFVIFPVISYG